jgi:acetyl-CoA synthetase
MSAAADFLRARDFLLAHRTDYAAVRQDFRLPQPSEFNWALDHFDALAAGNDTAALWIVEESGEEHRLSFATLAARSDQVANWLRAQGVRRHDRILLMLGNEVALWETMLAAIKLGAVVIPATSLLTRDDLCDRLMRGAVRHVIAGSADTAKFEDLEGDYTRIAVGAPRAGWRDFAASNASPRTFTPDGSTRATDPLLLYFTSGTTSQPKLVVHTHQSYPIGHLSTMYWIGLRPGDIHLNISSPGWAKHAWSCFFAPWNAGACVFIYNYSRFNGKAMLSVLERCRVTTLCAPPTVWRMLIQEDIAAFSGRLAVRELIGAGEPLNPEIIKRVQAAWGITIRDGFGQTETTAMIGNSPGQPVKPGSMGRPLPGYDVVLLDLDGVPADEGEVSVRLDPRPVGLMESYLGDAERNAEVMRDGFYRTGDVGQRDADGYITYVGRIDDVFKASDYRISPFELESVAIEHPAIGEAAVVPSPDPLRLAVPKCFVSLRPGYAASPELAADVFAFLRKRLAPYKRIRRLEFAELPKTLSGKIRRAELRRLEARRCAANERGSFEFVEDETAGEERYRAIFNVSLDAISLWDADLCMIDANPAYFEMYGYSRAEVIGQRFPSELPPDYVAAQQALIRRTLAGESCQLETAAIRKNGERLLIEAQTVPVRYRGATHAITVARDITKRKAAEAERMQLETQLRQAQKMEAIGHLAAGIAHDFNNILTGMLGYIVLANERQEAIGDAKLGGYLEQAQAACRRARDLIQQLLTFSRGRRGERQAISLSALVAEAHGLVRSTMPATLEVQVALDEVAPVVADRVQIEQVLLNLCINARDALHGTGTVDVIVRATRSADLVCSSCRTRVVGDFVELVVCDDGPGIPPDVRGRIFEPFFSTKDAGKGSGMGLAVVHGIVHEHGGHVVVEAAQERGTTFRILLPPGAADRGAEARSDASGAPPRAARPVLRGRVLVVDDEQSVAEFMRELLRTWGLEVDLAPGPDEALSMLGGDPAAYDLVITDQTMPRMSGVQLAGRIARLSPAPPVVLYTGYADNVCRHELEAACVKDLVRKPVEPAELRAVVAGHIHTDRVESRFAGNRSPDRQNT